MRAIIYAAGRGTRLGESHAGPKVLLRFNGESLIERHLRLLEETGITEIVVVTGYQAEELTATIEKTDRGLKPVILHNPDYTLGSIVTQWVARDYISAGGPVILMDADVLYDRRMIARLKNSPHENCFLLDRNIEPGEEPVKLCVRDEHLVDFRKQPEFDYEWAGESVGFFKISAAMATSLVASTQIYIEDGRTGEYYDEALRDLLVAKSPGTFGFEDITGLPWTEIDFPEDVVRAENIILPRLES